MISGKREGINTHNKNRHRLGVCFMNDQPKSLENFFDGIFNKLLKLLLSPNMKYPFTTYFICLYTL